ncbi:MAG: hypothetical protein HW414_930 [Dehalococcoidia bacterium]|nr:hypothetical protein [Dehalococcoidia bacterium]
MNKLAYTTLGLVLILVMALGACAAPQTPSPAPTPQAPAIERPTPTTPQLTSEQQLIEAAKKEGEVTLWTFSFDPPGLAVIRAFQDKYPFLKWKYFDGDHPEILAKMSEERKAGRRSVDVVILNSDSLAELKDGGFLQEYDWSNTQGWKAQPSNKFWANIMVSIRFPVYNTNVVSPAEAPKIWDDLKNSRWRGNSLITVSARAFPTEFAYIMGDGKSLNWEKAESFWTEVVNNTRPRILSGFSGPTELLAAGEGRILLLNSVNTALNFILRGAPIGIGRVEKTSGSTQGIALVKDAPHPNAAKLLANFLTSAEGHVLYMNLAQQQISLAPFGDSRVKSNQMVAAAGIDWTPLPVELITAENRLRATTFWNKLLERRG